MYRLREIIRGLPPISIARIPLFSQGALLLLVNVALCLANPCQLPVAISRARDVVAVDQVRWCARPTWPNHA